jgi:hypothetical protein
MTWICKSRFSALMIVSKFGGKQKLGLSPYDFEYENKIMNLNLIRRENENRRRDRRNIIEERGLGRR